MKAINKFLNPFVSKVENLNYYEVPEDSKVFEIGDYAIYTYKGYYLYTFKDICISNLGGVKKELLTALHEGIRPEGSERFQYDRILDTIEIAKFLIDRTKSFS